MDTGHPGPVAYFVNCINSSKICSWMLAVWSVVTFIGRFGIKKINLGQPHSGGIKNYTSVYSTIRVIKKFVPVFLGSKPGTTTIICSFIAANI